jgi:anti-sigma-K factor RskA
MENQTENSTEKALEVIAENNSLSVYTVNFTQHISGANESQLLPSAAEKQCAAEAKKRGAVSRQLFRWRSAIAISAILAVAVLHFTYQLSFQTIAVENQTAATPVPVAEKTLREETAQNKPVEIEAEIIDEKSLRKRVSLDDKKVSLDEKPSRDKVLKVKSRPIENAAVRQAPQNRKRIIVETRAERLRRAEKILTGI